MLSILVHNFLAAGINVFTSVSLIVAGIEVAFSINLLILASITVRDVLRASVKIPRCSVLLLFAFRLSTVKAINKV